MAKATKKSSTNAVTAHATCPVVDLARQVAGLWDAHEGVENDKLLHPSRRRDLMEEIDNWRDGFAEIISFTQAKSLAGALVQIALAVDELETLVAQVSDEETVPGQSRIERLLGSAARVVRSSLGAAEYQSVKAMLETNGLRHIDGGDWLGSVKTWERKGRALREKRAEE